MNISDSRKDGLAFKLLLFIMPLVILAVTPRLWSTSIIATGGYLLLIISSVAVNPKGATINRWMWFYIFFMVIFLCSAILFNPAVNSYGIQKGIYFILVILPLSAAIFFLFRKPEDLRYVLWGFAAFGLFIATMLVFRNQYILGTERYLWAGNLCAISAVIFFQFWLIKNKFLALPLIVIAILGIAVSAAKQSVAVLFVCLVAILIFNLLDLKHKLKETITILALVLFTLIFWGSIKNLYIFRDMLNRFNYVMNLRDNPLFGERAVLFKLAWQEFLKYPLLGIGIGGFERKFGPYYLYPHNIFLEILCEFGILGAIIFFIPLFFSGFLIIQRWIITKKTVLIHLFLLFVCFLIIANFSGDFISNRGVWIFGILMFRYLSFSYSTKT